MLRRAQSGYADVVATGLERLAPGRPSVSGPLARNCAVTSMVHFLLEVIETMDTGQFRVNTRGTGNRQYPPSMMLALLVYCYATGRFSSRVIERSSWEDVAVRYLCAGEHPDHDTICKFRRENLKAFERFFVHVLEVATQSGALKKVGTVSVDGTKLKANASKHSAMSHGHAEKVLEQLESEVKELTHRAEEADRQEQSQCETKLPEEIALRQKRMERIREAVDAIERREREKSARERELSQAKVRERKDRRERGETVRGPEPKEVEEKIDPKAQYNFTDPESRIMKTKDGFQQCHNAQAAVEVESMLVVANDLSNRANDKGQLVSMVEKTAATGFETKEALADTGYYSQSEVEALEDKGIEAFVAVERQAHGRSLASILGEEEIEQTTKPEELSPRQKMKRKLASPRGRERYALRKQTVEPVFGIIKEVMRFRQFLMRGTEKAAGEWNLVCCSYNIKRLFNLVHQPAVPACAQVAENRA